ncbi:hypothetical protein Taro_010752 [Colocasia esculenta]|uniref:4-hydroxybenzoate polyprenyltransferase, mitochondrial n=1 Tax=Colocasia esculenta TaxID=4460 RepID=A0A843U3Y4_COLES|nr:hypothetical protein [Colocasia esculenta]
MALRLARASRRTLLRRCSSPSLLVESSAPFLLFSHVEDSETSESNKYKALHPPSPFQRLRSLWAESDRHRRQSQQGGVELIDWFHGSRLLFPASISSSPEAAREGGKRRQAGSNDKERAASSSSRSWVERYLPGLLQPYALLARLDKPIGTWLLAWPCMSITIAANPGSFPDLKMLTLFGCGAVLLRGAGCTVNDLLDRDIDNKVERTKSRPIASGLLTPFQGLTFLGLQLLLGLGILLQLNNFRCVVTAAGFLISPNEEIYILGLTFNWGALLGCAAVKGTLDLAIVIPLYCSGVFWTLVYDTIYAHQDKEDDLKVGVKSTALRFGDLTKNWISGFGIACLSSLALSGYNAELAWPYYAFLSLAAGQLGWQIWTVDLSSRADCNRKCIYFQQVVWSFCLWWDPTRSTYILKVDGEEFPTARLGLSAHGRGIVAWDAHNPHPQQLRRWAGTAAAACLPLLSPSCSRKQLL